MRLLRPPPVDLAVAGVFVALIAAESVLSSAIASPLLHLGVAGLAMASLAWRRALPEAVAVVVMASNLVVDPDGQHATVLALVLVAYTIGAETDPPRSYLGLGLVLVPFVGVLALEALQPSDLAAAVVFLIGPWSVGVAVRQRTRRTVRAEAAALAVEQQRDREVAQAAAAERTRIARELHDVVSHAISVVAIQTQVVRRRLPAELEREVSELAAVEATAREALAEMRRLFGVLRAEGEAAPLAPQPGLSELERLCAQVRDAGLGVTIRFEGAPRPLAPGLDLAAYRIVQEGLTNALRHAGARHASVVLDYGADRLQVVVEDDGGGFAPVAGTIGHGLVGIRERVALYGGSLTIGEGGLGGTRLLATLPLPVAVPLPTAGGTA